MKPNQNTKQADTVQVLKLAHDTIKAQKSKLARSIQLPQDLLAKLEDLAAAESQRVGYRIELGAFAETKLREALEPKKRGFFG